MAHAGLEMFNPVTGQRTVFLQTAADTAGALLQLEWAGGAGWSAGPEHVHPKQEERFEVLAGRARSRVDGRERIHEPGDVFVAPAGSVHTVSNAGDGDVRLLVEFRPALRSEDVLETLAALARAGRVKPDGAPRDVVDLALLVRDYEDEIYLARPPLALQRLVLGPIAWLGHRLGRRPTRPYPVPATA
jgi:mannose-6-phosphate isomerase-like protein (cupin superfamily)